jgi:hypothetical protein
MRSEEEIMSNRILAVLALALALTSDPALADLRHNGPPPVFSASEREIIGRNAALAALVGSDPWLVRRVLDAIDLAGASRSGVDEKCRPGHCEQPPDPASNPDLEYLGRSSPEAAHDLFLLIKRASNKGNAR